MAYIPPSLSQSELPPQPPAVAAASAQTGGGSAFLRLFYSVEENLDKIAAMIPSKADEVEKLKGSVKDFLTKCLAEGLAPKAEPEPRAGAISFGRPL